MQVGITYNISIWEMQIKAQWRFVKHILWVVPNMMVNYFTLLINKNAIKTLFSWCWIFFFNLRCIWVKCNGIFYIKKYPGLFRVGTIYIFLQKFIHQGKVCCPNYRKWTFSIQCNSLLESFKLLNLY